MPTVPEIVSNTEGLKTLYRKDIDETYHSVHGAVIESKHVFIESGLNFGLNQTQLTEIKILEIGFGTGLNAMLTLLESEKQNFNCIYHSLETIPLSYDLVKMLDYNANWTIEQNSDFIKLHTCFWNKEEEITPRFTIKKIEQGLELFEPKESYNLIYFDAFGPDKQAELWTLELFQKLFNCLQENGILVTYSAKGDVRRNLQAVGFKVEKIAGPPHKRHMLRAIKLQIPNE